MKRCVKSILCMLASVLLLLSGGAVTAQASSVEETGVADTIEVFGREADPNAELLDLNRIPLQGTAQVEEILHLFPNLKQVEMCGCGISNEDMAALCRKYPDIKFVWEVTVCKGIKVRTDITYFMAFQHGISENFIGDYSNLKYCPDIELIDCGHYRVADISFVTELPKLKYLLLCDGILEDLSPIGDCTSLEFLELFVNPVDDFAPLLNLTNLVDLNISYTAFGKTSGNNYSYTGAFGDITPLYHMTWLDRLWICNSRLPQEELDALQAALVHTIIQTQSSSSTDRGWRHSPHYFQGRDILGSPYMIA